MNTPIALNQFYDELMRHDWFYDRSDDHAVWKRGEAEMSRLQSLAKTSPEHQTLYRQVQAYQNGPRDAEKPVRPADGAAFTLPPARPPEAALSQLSDEDRESVLAAPNPAARLAQVNRRLTLDAKLSVVDVLNAFGATPSATNPSRWTLPDGARLMVKVERQAWVEQNATLSTGNGATRLAMRVLGQTEDAAIQTLESKWGLAGPRGPQAPAVPPSSPIPAPASASVAPSAPPAPVAAEPAKSETAPRWRRRPG